LADVFSDAHIRYKVIVISACYAGGFIDALKNDTTMIITAARADRTSFGCGTNSDITDFGRAFFVEGLNHNDSFQDAYTEAAKLVDSWETRDNEEHSHPQIVTSPKIEAQLKKWRSGIQLGPPLLFKPASAPKTKDDDSRTAAASPLN
jgi:peptidase C13-like protein